MERWLFYKILNYIYPILKEILTCFYYSLQIKSSTNEEITIYVTLLSYDCVCTIKGSNSRF